MTTYVYVYGARGPRDRRGGMLAERIVATPADWWRALEPAFVLTRGVAYCWLAVYLVPEPSPAAPASPTYAGPAAWFLDPHDVTDAQVQ